MEDNESRADTVTRLKRLWQSEPERYWPALRASGLSAQEVWPNLPKHVPSEGLKKAGPKK
jgi:hypothetical protein